MHIHVTRPRWVMSCPILYNEGLTNLVVFRNDYLVIEKLNYTRYPKFVIHGPEVWTPHIAECKVRSLFAFCDTSDWPSCVYNCNFYLSVVATHSPKTTWLKKISKLRYLCVTYIYICHPKRLFYPMDCDSVRAAYPIRPFNWKTNLLSHIVVLFSLSVVHFQNNRYISHGKY